MSQRGGFSVCYFDMLLMTMDDVVLCLVPLKLIF